MISKLRAQYAKHQLLAATFEYLERGGKLTLDYGFNVDWDGFAWTANIKSHGMCPASAYLIMNQFISDEIDGVDKSTQWAWLQEATVATQLEVSNSFLGGVIRGYNFPFEDSAHGLYEYNMLCEVSYKDYKGNDEVPAYCENHEEFFQGFEVGKEIYLILNQSGVI